MKPSATPFRTLLLPQRLQPPSRTRLPRRNHVCRRAPILANTRCIHHAAGTRRSYATTSSTSYVSAAELQFAQPVYETHPHVLNAGECKSSPPVPRFRDFRVGGNKHMLTVGGPASSSDARHHSPGICRPSSRPRPLHDRRQHSHPPSRLLTI